MILDDLPDQLERNAAVGERERNVVVDAGAGTGKTGLLVRRFVQLVAPASTGTVPVDVGRLAAITFTRRAAGELGLRIRQELLSELARSTDTVHRSRLREAIAGFDGASVGTIHSFCDRLLRPYAAEAGLPAMYDVVEDGTELVRETVDLLLRGTRDGTLHAQLPGVDEILVQEAGPTLRDIPRCGLLLETQETPQVERYGLDSLVDALVRSRDVQPLLPAFPEFEPTTFRGYARELLALVEPVAHLPGAGVSLLRGMAETLRALEREEDPVVLFGAFARPLGRREPLRRPARRADLADDDAAWETWAAIFGTTRKNPPRVPPLRDDLLAPLREWLAARLARLQPVVVGAYDAVKRRRGCLDPLDLLLVLRDLLQLDKATRAPLQRRFDHLLVDEFQDTDPLQAEILLYLGEDGAHATSPDEVRLRPGRLTVVGDPKQSIYRFRRADIRMYDEVTRRLASEGAARFTLSASLRTDPALVSWLDDRFLDILAKRPASGERFDAATGRAFHEPLQAGRGAAAGTSRVHVVPVLPVGASAEDFRRLEAEALAHYIQWLVTESRETIPTSATERRPVRFGDIAVLAAVTTNVGMLADPFDAQRIPYSLSGGRLFVQEDLHCRFVLGLRALADREDGVAEAALFMPPFFALDHADILRERRDRQRDPATQASALPSVVRAREALALVSELRRRRRSRSPGETARDLLERSAIGRVTALGANGRQRLSGLRELCLTLERIAARDRLDYDAATGVLRDWIDRPVQLDPPAPIGEDAVRILTVHQAKGLEFPVVVLWDCRGTMRPRNERPVWLTSHDGSAWTIGMDGLSFEEPPGTDLVGRERAYQTTERERLQYVAATRARDLLVVPCDGEPGTAMPGAQSANRRLLRDAPADFQHVLEPFREGHPPAWARPAATAHAVTVEPEAPASRALAAAIPDSHRPVLSPRAVSLLAWETTGRSPPDEVWADELADSGETHRSRFGSQFGTAVHRAIGLALAHGTSPEESVRRVARRCALERHHQDATLDVARALATLASLGITQLTSSVRIEYPVAAPASDGYLVVGTIDLLAAREPDWLLLDFKTDSTGGAGTDAFRPYEEQVRLYARLIRPRMPASASLRMGLLFTESGDVRWIEDIA